MNGDLQKRDHESTTAGPNGTPRKGTRFFDRTDWLSFGITAALVLSGYLWTLAPSVTLELSGIYCVGAMYAGVSHPPGYPLWTIYAWLFTVLLPVSNIAWRVGVSSAVAGALTCGVTALMVSRGGGFFADLISSALRPRQFALLRVIAGYLAGMALGFDGTLWRTGVVVNTWPFSLLLFSIALCLLMKWFHVPDRKQSLYAACLVYGLTVSNSQALVAAGLGLQVLIMLVKPAVGRDMFFGNCALILIGFLSDGIGGHSPIFQFSYPSHWIPLVIGIISVALCIIGVIKTRSFFSEWKTVLRAGAMFVAGLATYLYVPLASMTNPPVNWGYPRTVTGFFHVLSRGQYERINPIQSVSRLFEAIGIYAEIAMKEFGWIYLLLALIPIWFLRRMQSQERRWILGLAAVFLCLALIMLLGINPSHDRQSVEWYKVFFSASHLLLAIAAGYGVILLGLLLEPRVS